MANKKWEELWKIMHELNEVDDKFRDETIARCPEEDWIDVYRDDVINKLHDAHEGISLILDVVEGRIKQSKARKRVSARLNRETMVNRLDDIVATFYDWKNTKGVNEDTKLAYKYVIKEIEELRDKIENEKE